MIQEGVFALLSADAGVSALVSNRIFGVVAPDDLALYPCIAYSSVGGASDPSLSSSGVLRQRLQVDCSALDYPTAAQIRAAVIAAMNGWQELLSDGTNVLNAVLLNPGTDFANEQRLFRCMVEFYILFTLP